MKKVRAPIDCSTDTRQRVVFKLLEKTLSAQLRLQYHMGMFGIGNFAVANFGWNTKYHPTPDTIPKTTAIIMAKDRLDCWGEFIGTLRACSSAAGLDE